MRTSFEIFLRDLKALGRNPAALLVVIALLVLPGLYAWYCIVANWDPYSNTGNVPIAVVNEDEGATSDLTGEINLGNQVADELHDNHNIDWHFYDTEEEALEATRRFECYAALVMPKDLSKNVVGIFDGSDEQPVIYFYPNEKQNAVAVKVSDSAAQTLVTQINQQFASTVNEIVLEKVQEGANKVDEQTSQTRRTLASEVDDTQAQIANVTQSLDSTISAINGWRESVAGSQASLSAAAQQLPALRTSLADSSATLNNLRVETIAFDSVFSKSLSQTNLALANLSLRISADMSATESDVARVSADLDKSIELMSAELAAHGPNEVTEQLQVALQKLQSASDHLQSAVALADASTQNMNANVQTIVDKTNAANDTFSREVLPALSNGTYDLGISLSGLSSAVGQFEPQIVELQEVLAQTDAALVDAIAAIEQAKALLSNVNAHLESTSTDLNAMGSALKVDQIAELLDVDPDNLGQFISSPVNLVTEEIYPVSNYGTAVAPFYTCLALWIGCFILISLIKLEVDRTGFESATPTQRYFGRWLLLVLLALVQSQIICGVDIALGIDCTHPVAFMASGAVCSFAFMNLLYALALTFRNIGRTLCILLLIMQVPGSSGMYPIEMMPAFFRAVHPFLPFTYGINAMREALCGMQGIAYATDLIAVALIVPLAFLIGLVIRPYMMNVLLMFDEELRKTGFFAGELHGQGTDTERVRGMMRILASHDAYRDSIERRALSFNRRYPRLRKAGSIAVFAIPFALLVIMLPFNLILGPSVSTDAKLMALIVALILILCVQIALIVMEYLHRVVLDETRLLGDRQVAEAPEYNTLIDAVDDKRRAAEDGRAQAIEHFKNQTINDQFSVAPPLPSSLVSSEAPNGSPANEPDPTEPPKRYGGAARDIFFTDMRLGFQSVIGVVVIMLLVITPSLYAWFNIAGCWDPYSNTGNLKVAVANEDAGYKSELIPVRVNVGDTIVAQLRSNDSFNWVFVDEQQAVDGVTDSSYYAAIVIPDDFSQNMMTYLTDGAKYPDVVYYTNEKENPIAPIITQKGADSIQEGIRRTFTERVDETALALAADLSEYISRPEVGTYLNKMAGHLDDAARDLRNGAYELRSLSSLSGTVSNVVATAGSTMNGVRASGETARNAIASAEAGAQSATTAFDQASAVIEAALVDSETELGSIAYDIDGALAELEASTTEVPASIYEAASVAASAGNAMHETARVTREAAELLTDETEREKMLAEAKRIDAIGDSYDTLSSSITAMASRSENLGPNIEQTRSELTQLVADADAAIAEARTYYNNNVKSSASSMWNTIEATSTSVHSIVDGLDTTIGGLVNSTDGLNGQLTSLGNGLTQASSDLDEASSRLSNTRKNLSDALASGDLKQIKAIALSSDVEHLADRLSAPLEVNRQPIYPVANFGSQMASFYTVLSLWVGALVTISAMRVRIVEERLEQLRLHYRTVRTRHEFFGRYGIFGFIALLQSVLVLLGDLMLLHIQCDNPIMFVVLGVFIGQVFCLFVYTMTELFGNVGKALCVILLIMQVAASGGTFPVEMLDPLLSSIVPYLPFYHGMCLLKECVAGIYWPAVGTNAAFLLIAVGILLLIGIVIRRPFRIADDWLERQLEKTGFM